MSSTSAPDDTDGRAKSIVLPMVLGLFLGALVGALVEASGYLHGRWSAIHELATPWALAGFFLARPVRQIPRAAAIGAGVLVAGVLGNAAFKLIFYPDTATRFWIGDLFGFLLAAAAIGAGLGLAAGLSRRTQSWSRAIGWAVPIGIALAETAFLWSGRLGLYGEKRAAVLTGIAATLVAAVAARESSPVRLVMCATLVAVITLPIMGSVLHLIPGLR